MILMKWAEEKSDDPSSYCDAWRRVLEVGFLHFGVTQQYRPRGREWFSSHVDGWSVDVTRHFELGPYHAYYDGPHCSFSLGFLHINWSNWKCKKCLSEAV